MTNTQVRCVLVKIHGIGRQQPNWSKDFDDALDQKLATLSQAERDAVISIPVYWADLSKLPGTGVAAGTAGPPGPDDAAYAATYGSYAQYYATNELATTGVPAGAAGAAAGLGSVIGGIITKVIDLKDGAVTAADHFNDISNYVSNNGVRLPIQQRLSDALLTAHATYPNASIMLASHSQGTIISYDVLRLTGAHLPRLTTWVTMGCPLGWYLTFGRWGADQMGIRQDLRWLNFYDDEDPVGQALSDLVTWPSPTPADADVDNRGHGLDAHDHWHNPEVVDRYFRLIQDCLS